MKDRLKYIIREIQQLQSSGTTLFPEGIFPAHRVNPMIGYRRPDTTIFFSTIIAFTLRSIRDETEGEVRSAIDEICTAVINNYPQFQNKDGLATYNFWRTKPSKHFPNGYIFRHFEHFRIPDDIDDTAFIYLTTDRRPEEVMWLKNKLALHANRARHQIRNTFQEYRELEAYSTWFGKNMYIEFDACVLSNMLYCIYSYNLPLNRNDEDSLLYIRSVIETNRYLETPFRCAHQYPRTSLIIYHISRLMAKFAPVQLMDMKSKLIEDTKRLLSVASNPMDRVILSSSLLRFGLKPPRIAVENFTEIDFKGFYFFIAGLLTAYEHKWLYKMAEHPLFHMYWICNAHSWTLLAEYEVLWNRVVETGVSEF
jgi:hypothetical protein